MFYEKQYEEEEDDDVRDAEKTKSSKDIKLLKISYNAKFYSFIRNLLKNYA